MTHTPGPWRIEESQEDGLFYIVADQSKNWNNPIVCSFYDDVTPEDSICGAEYEAYPNAKANATLIAKAPELLELCERLLGVVLHHAHPSALWAADSLLDSAREVIAKAKGKTDV